ncbi:uncharacterized protein IL334_006456 [Kwoniella shivajii]|uniref:NADH:ubiquinone oxidoreductase intermediate-associated protein 30 domain-containing protein n=1 Tax=Kwoniella shivajii TaxID=564305 RepID=A0ABZ1D7W1_9TREE|nr:hypothetical protein IL334_006456 [Kwoniella shivajii]
MSLRNVLDPKATKISVSSTTPGSSKKHLLNPSASDEGQPWSSNIPSSLHLTFDQPIKASHFALTFQGGFVSTAISVWVARSEDAEGKSVGLGLMLGGKVFPEDRNKRQVFKIAFPPVGLSPTDENGPAASKGPTIVTEITPQEAQSGAVEAHPDGKGIVKKSDDDELPYLTELKLEFEKSSDQYGRITLYSIEVLRE